MLLVWTRSNFCRLGKGLDLFSCSVAQMYVTSYTNIKIFYYIPSSEILEFCTVINFDIITRDDINFHFHILP